MLPVLGSLTKIAAGALLYLPGLGLQKLLALAFGQAGALRLEIATNFCLIAGAQPATVITFSTTITARPRRDRDRRTEMTAFVASFLLLCFVISGVYAALKYDTVAEIKRETLHTFTFFLVGVLALAVLIWYYSR